MGRPNIFVSALKGGDWLLQETGEIRAPGAAHSIHAIAARHRRSAALVFPERQGAENLSYLIPSWWKAQRETRATGADHISLFVRLKQKNGFYPQAGKLSVFQPDPLALDQKRIFSIGPPPHREKTRRGAGGEDSPAGRFRGLLCSQQTASGQVGIIGHRTTTKGKGP